MGYQCFLTFQYHFKNEVKTNQNEMSVVVCLWESTDSVYNLKHFMV